MTPKPIECEDCERIYHRLRRRKTKDGILRCPHCAFKQRRIRDPIARRVREREYYKNNPGKFSAYRRAYYLRNRDKIVTKNKSNRDAINRYAKRKYNTDVTFRLGKVLRSRLRETLKHGRKDKIDELLGCSVGELKLYLENYFPTYPGMSWANYGLGWHVDHFLPLSSFDLSDSSQLREACHYTNLQPLWAEENLRKNRRL